jgi:argininosuccinate synthase
MASQKETVLLAYNGDINSSCILRYLLDSNYDVFCLVCDIGQRSNMTEVKERALSIGASRVFVEDLKQEFVTNFVYRSIQANAAYDGRNLLGTALSRPCIARRQIEIARRENCAYVAHGATGKTNDVVRFELVYYALDANVKILAPHRDAGFAAINKTRATLVEYAKKHNIAVAKSEENKSEYNEDHNIFSIQRTGSSLDDPSKSAPENAYTWIVDPLTAPDTADTVSVEFKAGVPVRVTDEAGRATTDAVGILTVLNDLGAKHGVGRVDMVINVQVGVKNRMVLETPGGTILRTAHSDLEGLVMDREVRRLRDMMSPKFAELVFNGFWFSPEMEFIVAAVIKSQETLDGVVKLRICKGTVVPISRESHVSMFDSKIATYNLDSFSTPEDTTGYVRVTATRLRAHAAITKQLSQTK